MSSPEPPSFHLRLPQSLKDNLQAARGSNSLNAEIVQRLQLSFAPDPALQLADIIRPALAALDESDQARIIAMAAETVGILVKGRGKKRK
jgi:hypothetical protein